MKKILSLSFGLLLISSTSHSQTLPSVENLIYSALQPTLLGQPNGVASLDGTGKVPAAQIPTATTSSNGGVPSGGSSGRAWNPVDGWFTPASIGSNSGTVTTTSFTTANGFSGTITNPTTTPAFTLSTTVTGMVKGNGTALSAAVAGTDYLTPTGNGSGLTGITNAQVAGSAGSASPALTGVPTAPTPATSTNTTQIATTAFVQAVSAAGTPIATTSQLYGGSGTAGVEVPITLGTNLSMSGTTLNASGGSGITQLTGDVTTPVNSSGSAVATLNASGVTAGTYSVLTVNAKGLVTGGSAVTPVVNGGTGVSSQFQTLTYTTTITENVTLGAIATLTPTGNFTFACPTNMVAGGSYQTRFVQDGTGSRVATWPSCFKWPSGTAGVLSTTANAVDVVTFTSFDGSTATAVISKGFS